MNKYDTMITVNRQRSEEKIAQAIKAIRELQMEQERITVPRTDSILLSHLVGKRADDYTYIFGVL